MRPVDPSRRAWASAALRLALSSVPVALLGCGGDREVPVVSNGKSRAELEKDIENPYGAEIKNTIRNKKKTAKDSQ